MDVAPAVMRETVEVHTVVLGLHSGCWQLVGSSKEGLVEGEMSVSNDIP